MKHTPKITIILISLFFLAQIIGLITINKYISPQIKEDGSVIINHPDTIAGPQPEIAQQDKTFNFITITLAVLAGTAILFIIIKYNLKIVWKLWFLLAISTSLAIAFGVYINILIAGVLGLILGIIRIFKPSTLIHNLTEMFIYTGITILILPWLNLTSAVILLLLISLYDIIAVWKSGHMIKLAEFQMNSRMFAGLSMNYKKISGKKHSKKSKNKESKKQQKTSNAILGGGDIAFPLLFSAAVMEHLIIAKQIPQIKALLLSLIVTIGATIALSILLFKSEKGKFYPAMPFISAGCFIGFGIILLF